MTNDTILESIFPCPESDERNSILQAMDAARRDEAIRFAEWHFNKIVRQNEEGFYFDYSGGTAFTMEQLYSIFKISDNEHS